MKKNFAGQPDLVLTLTANDLTTNVNPIQYPKVFGKAPLFVDNCNGCQKNNNMMNLDGLKMFAEASTEPNQSKFDQIFGVFQFGVNTWSAEQQRKADIKQAETAAEIERLKSQQLDYKAQSDTAKAETVVDKIKAYKVPIIATGVVLIGGIATYFYFKNK